MQSRFLQQRSAPRRGSLLPAIAVALLVAGGSVALVLDQLWLSTARRELQTSAIAAALAAGQEMASEDFLKSTHDADAFGNRVREIAKSTALGNFAAGRLIAVKSDPGEDIRLGRPIVDPLTGQTTFIETDYAPTSVVIMTHCDREHGNPISLFMPYLTGQRYGDLEAIAEASISNEIQSVRPLDDANVPAWPLAILETTSNQEDSWTSCIEGGGGRDELHWNREKRLTVQQQDGLQEMRLQTGQEDRQDNVVIIDLGSGLRDDILQRQFRDGWSWEDLQSYGSELNLSIGPLEVQASTDLDGMPLNELSQMVGQTRIVPLFQKVTPEDSSGRSRVRLTRLVAVRLMEVTQQGEHFELVVQPTVIATRTAVVSDTPNNGTKNPYLYRLALTQ